MSSVRKRDVDTMSAKELGKEIGKELFRSFGKSFGLGALLPVFGTESFIRSKNNYDIYIQKNHSGPMACVYEWMQAGAYIAGAGISVGALYTAYRCGFSGEDLQNILATTQFSSFFVSPIAHTMARNSLQNILYKPEDSNSEE
jgi:hypothetical protein